jgi:hypothetical protein
VTYVEDFEQQRVVKALVSSIREFGGKYRDCPILYRARRYGEFSRQCLTGQNIELIPLVMESAFHDYPLAYKASPWRRWKKIVGKQIRTLIWMDPGVIVLNSIDALVLDKNYDVVVRPVTYQNNIGLRPGDKPNDYWMPIYAENRFE